MGESVASDEARHARLLLAILRGDRPEADRLCGRGPIDPSLFVKLCQEGDVSPWIHKLLGAPDAPPVGGETLEILARIRKKVRHDNLLLLAQNERALDLLLEAGVTPVALKGLDLLHRIYDRFDERTLDDVDLLIRPQELPAAIEALQSGGWTSPDEPERTHYIRSSHHLPMDSPGPIAVGFELHWNLAQEMRYSVDGEGLIDRSVPLEVSGRNIRRLEDHDLVAHLILHHFTHYFDRRLKWTVDLRAISELPGFDWNRVLDRLRQWNATVASGVSLRHLHKLFPQWIPAHLVAAMPVAAWRRALTAPLRTGHPLDLFRWTRNRRIQLYLAAVHLERPSQLPGWLAHRAHRDRHESDNPLDAGASSSKETPR